MTHHDSAGVEPKLPLSRERVLRAAVALADARGLAAVTIRSLADSLGLKPMSLYHYVRGKDDVLHGMTDQVFAEIDLPDPSAPWRDALRARAVSARTVLSRHPWALTILDLQPATGAATLRHHDAVLGVLLRAGFSLRVTARAYTLLDAYVYGFVLQEAVLPTDAGPPGDAAAATLDADRYPHLAAFAAGLVGQPGYSFGDEFEPVLDRVLDAIGALREDG
ncbi:TetR/AcrR family transcriptional regulator [Antribacter gilvus]|uniref:TetR/AcrR family transcriptional regulator n=1 Tax=Antribacter gilvus TaxID=2304675 RepID=UPI000F797B12|nr:TetR/AcrR family transcriptional regulator [Antribacter gilvus]